MSVVIINKVCIWTGLEGSSNFLPVSQFFLRSFASTTVWDYHFMIYKIVSQRNLKWLLCCFFTLRSKTLSVFCRKRTAFLEDEDRQNYNLLFIWHGTFQSKFLLEHCIKHFETLVDKFSYRRVLRANDVSWIIFGQSFFLASKVWLHCDNMCIIISPACTKILENLFEDWIHWIVRC